MKIKLMYIGKLKENFAQKGYEHYRAKLARFFKLEEIWLKDAPAKLHIEAKKEHEAKSILAALGAKDFLIVLDERGAEYTSRKLAAQMQLWVEDRTRTPCLLIGGAFGLADSVKQRANAMLRFGAVTWPHELCRVMLLEQLYRAATINSNIPYHHD